MLRVGNDEQSTSWEPKGLKDERTKTMVGMVRSGFFWRFVGGFAFGAVGILSLNPAQAAEALGVAAQLVA